jgi:hypothetical protein
VVVQERSEGTREQGRNANTAVRLGEGPENCLGSYGVRNERLSRICDEIYVLVSVFGLTV